MQNDFDESTQNSAPVLTAAHAENLAHQISEILRELYTKLTGKEPTEDVIKALTVGISSKEQNIGLSKNTEQVHSLTFADTMDKTITNGADVGRTHKIQTHSSIKISDARGNPVEPAQPRSSDPLDQPLYTGLGFYMNHIRCGIEFDIDADRGVTLRPGAVHFLAHDLSLRLQQSKTLGLDTEQYSPAQWQDIVETKIQGFMGWNNDGEDPNAHLVAAR